MENIKILAVCGFGIGSSLILKMNIGKVLEEDGIQAEVSNTDILTAPSEKCSFIVTSEGYKRELEGKVSVPVIVVDRFFDKNEIREKINLGIEKIK
ncbi:MAG: PTS sugar transporter subunit IIB [Clostridium chrysemydis]|uniref:PTS sugar transporter subunit IIB n=1 Tax=Clostridium chrysemydis TaxID=2665504 RepID=UPI003F3B1963